jgi:hypothetical protein
VRTSTGCADADGRAGGHGDLEGFSDDAMSDAGECWGGVSSREHGYIVLRELHLAPCRRLRYLHDPWSAST